MGRSATYQPMIRLLVVGAGFCPMVSFALGLGDIQIESRLNQPLRARIEVLDVSDEEWGRMQTHLNRQSAPDTLALQAHVLEAITVRTIQDSQHRHFVEIKSTEALAEPLFDLPVEVAGPTGRVIRNYSVLLDPPGVEDVRRAAVDSQASAAQVAQAEGSVLANGSPAADGAMPTGGSAMTGNDPQVASARSDRKPTRSNTTRRTSTSGSQAAQRRTRHVPASAGVSASADTRVADEHTPATQAAAASLAASAAQQELLKQLESLHQTLTKMQETIAAQNEQIADLTAKVARAESKAALAVSASAVSQPSASADVEASDTDATEDEVSPRPYFWLTVVLGAATAIALVSAIVIKWRTRRAARKAVGAQRASAVEQRTSQQGAGAGVSAGYGPDERYGSSASYKSTDRRKSSDHQSSSPSSLQKQMEADGRVQIDWDKEVWNTPEWLRLFGEQPALSGHGQQPSPQQPSAQQLSAHQPPGPRQSGSEPSDAPYSDAQHSRPESSGVEDADLASYTAALPEATSSGPAPSRAAAGAAPPAATSAPPTERDTAEMPKAYFADLPKVCTMEVPVGTQLSDSDSPTILATDLEELTQTMTERIFGEDTTKLAEAYAAAIRDRVPDHDIARRIDVDHEELLNAETTRVSDTETTRLSDTEAATLLSADLSNLTEGDLTNLTDLAELAELDATEIAKVGEADSTNADASKSTHADTAKPMESDTAKIPRADPKALGEGTMPNLPRLRRRAGRRR